MSSISHRSARRGALHRPAAKLLGRGRMGEVIDLCEGSAASCAWTTSAALECWSTIAAVDDFALCDPAHYIRVFPRLLPRSGTVPVALRGHILRCLAVLAWRSMAVGDDAAMEALCAGSSLARADMAALGAREHGRWFSIGVAGLEAGPAAEVRTASGAIDEARAFALVDALRREIDSETLRPFDLDDAALFAFTTGIHPAYLWPEALMLHEVCTAAGWLGHLCRRHRADLPKDLAEYFDDVLDLAQDGTPGVRDRHLAKLLPSADVVTEIGRAVRARLGGASAVVAWPGAASGPSPVPMRQDGGPS